MHLQFFAANLSTKFSHLILMISKSFWKKISAKFNSQSFFILERRKLCSKVTICKYALVQLDQLIKRFLLCILLSYSTGQQLAHLDIWRSCYNQVFLEVHQNKTKKGLVRDGRTASSALYLNITKFCRIRMKFFLATTACIIATRLKTIRQVPNVILWLEQFWRKSLMCNAGTFSRSKQVLHCHQCN